VGVPFEGAFEESAGARRHPEVSGGRPRGGFVEGEFTPLDKGVDEVGVAGWKQGDDVQSFWERTAVAQVALDLGASGVEELEGVVARGLQRRTQFCDGAVVGVQQPQEPSISMTGGAGGVASQARSAVRPAGVMR
jgi:hypothetical protein